MIWIQLSIKWQALHIKVFSDNDGKQQLTKHWSLQMIMRTDSMFTMSAFSRISSAVGYGSATCAQQMRCQQQHWQ
jgi:hypothetical protein